jgi:hypothetical protein
MICWFNASFEAYISPQPLTEHLCTIDHLHRRKNLVKKATFSYNQGKTIDPVSVNSFLHNAGFYYKWDIDNLSFYSSPPPYPYRLMVFLRCYLSRHQGLGNSLGEAVLNAYEVASLLLEDDDYNFRLKIMRDEK